MFTSEKSAPANRWGDTPAGERRASTERRETGPSSLLDPLYIARSIWSSRLLILFAVLLGLAGAVAVAMTTPKVYKATAQVLIDPRDLKVVANEVTPNGLPSEATLALIESQTSVILSSNVLSRVLVQADLENDAEFNGRMKTGIASLLPSLFTELGERPDEELRDREQRTMERFRRALSVERETKSFVINLTVQSVDAAKAARLANLTADVFIAEQGRVQSETARRATASITARLSELRQSVVETEGRVEAYKSENALIGVGGRLVDDDYITRINDQLAKARGDITALRVRAESMKAASVDDVVKGTLPEELASAALARLRQSYSDLAQQAAILATKLGPRHPQRLASEGALSSARQAIAAELARIVAAAQTELARAEETERNLTSQIGELKTKQVETSGSFVKLRELEREVDASRAVYEAFLLRARETSEQESLNTANVRVISEATAPLDPAGMSRKVIVLAGLILGLIAGIGIAGALAVVRMLRIGLAQDGIAEPSRPPAAEPVVATASDVVMAPDAVVPPQAEMKPDTAPAHEVAPEPSEPGVVLETPPVAAFDAGEEPHGEALAEREPEQPSAPATSAAPVEPPADREALRNRIRALSASNDRDRRETIEVPRGFLPASASAEVAGLQNDIASIRDTLAEIRRRRATIAGS